MADPTIICVLGMHRSGTSLVTRILNLLGVYLGPEEHLMAAAGDNPKGFWEHRGLVTINEDILAMFGGGVDDPPLFPQNWQDVPQLAGLGERARAVISKDFAAADLWGWKDPRTCLTVAFWQRLLPPIHYVHCLRSPADAVQSLQKQARRYGLVYSVEKCIWLWLAYVQSALTHTQGQPHLLIFYEDVMDDWAKELRRLADFLGRPDRAEQVGMQDAVRQFIDHGLRHHRGAEGSADQGNPGARQRALAHCQRLYDTLRSGGAPGSEFLERTVREAQDLLAPEIPKQERQVYAEQVQLARCELTALVPPGDSFILVDDGRWDTPETLAGGRRIPFLERDGQYWGKPADDQSAIRELERLRHAGASLMVFGWPAFWWLDSYAGMHRHLRTRYRLVLENDRLVVFDLRP
jgi:hypothetical protein